MPASGMGLRVKAWVPRQAPTPSREAQGSHALIVVAAHGVESDAHFVPERLAGDV